MLKKGDTDQLRLLVFDKPSSEFYLKTWYVCQAGFYLDDHKQCAGTADKFIGFGFQDTKIYRCEDLIDIFPADEAKPSAVHEIMTKIVGCPLAKPADVIKRFELKGEDARQDVGPNLTYVVSKIILGN
jgi:hypothetical protein